MVVNLIFRPSTLQVFFFFENAGVLTTQNQVKMGLCPKGTVVDVSGPLGGDTGSNLILGGQDTPLDVVDGLKWAHGC